MNINKKYSDKPLLTRITALLCGLLTLTLLIGCGGSAEEDEALPSNGSGNTVVTVQGGGPLPEVFESDPDCIGQYTANQMTDLILVTGQSNVIGPDTEVSAIVNRFGQVLQFSSPDQPHPRVFAWTVDPNRNNAGQGWKVARLTQSWHDSNPGVGGIARNNFAFHFAKQVAKRSSGCRVIGIVMVSEGGKGIAHWDDGASGWNQVERHLNEAMSAIGKQSVDGVLWHQGESDWIIDGTCYPGDLCVNGQPDYYAQKLYSRIADPAINNPIGSEALIDRLQRQNWFASNRPFIAAETLQAPVNVHLNKLNTDDNPWTATVRADLASGLETNILDPFNNHYSAEGLRQLGRRYAREYMKMYSIESQ